MLIILWSAYTGSGFGGWFYILYSVLLTCLIFGCVVLHELGHAMAARYFGVATRSITLLPIGGVAALERIPEKPREELIIAAAGPMVNVAIGMLLLLVFGLPDASMFTFGAWSLTGIGQVLLYVNIIMIVFNMIPAFPMDGGRIFRALLAIKLSYPRATLVASVVGQLIAVLMFIAGLLTNPVLCLIGMFVFLGARAENNMVHLRAMMQGRVVRQIMDEHPLIVSPFTTAAGLISEADAANKDAAVVMDGWRILGVVDRRSWISIRSGDLLTASDLMTRPVILLSPDMPLNAFTALVSSTQQRVYPVVEQGAVVGVITLSMLEPMMNKLLRGQSVVDVRGTPPSSRERKSFIDVG